MSLMPIFKPYVVDLLSKQRKRLDFNHIGLTCQTIVAYLNFNDILKPYAAGTVSEKKRSMLGVLNDSFLTLWGRYCVGK